MNNESRMNVDETMTEIRKAYRLIYIYQSRILDLAEYIGSQFNLSKPQGYSCYSESFSNKGKVSFDSWAWDWLPMYAYFFYFAGHKNKDLGVVILTDSHAFQAKDEKPSSFGKPEDSETKIYLVATTGKVDVNQIYEKIIELSNDRLKSISFSDDKGKKVNVYIKGFSIKSFADNDSADKNIAEFKDKVLKKGLVL